MQKVYLGRHRGNDRFVDIDDLEIPSIEKAQKVLTRAGLEDEKELLGEIYFLALYLKFNIIAENDGVDVTKVQW